MQIAAKEDASAKKEYAAETLSFHIQDVAYASIPLLRHDIEKFLLHRGLSSAYIGMVLLSVSEVITNLVKHPSKKADMAEITISLKSDILDIDIADNSTPFADFDAKCNAAFARTDPALGLAESGYGIGCILQQHEKAFYIPMNESVDGLNHFRITDKIGNAPARTRKVFLIDDDPVSLAIHKRMLENVYEVIAFDEAKPAVEAFASQKPDMVISDLSMPGMDGIALRKALSELKNGDVVPFIFLSGHRNSAHSSYISKIGVDDFLFKPISKERLLAVSARLMNRSSQLSEALQGRFHQDLVRLLNPSLPEKYAGWKIRTLSQAAEAGGGDFTLHHETPSHLLAVLADVMGHGQQAKFFSYAYAGYLRSIFRMLSDNTDPADFLERLSKSVDGDEFLESTLVTCLAFELFQNGEIKAASAGHPAPLLIGKDRVETLHVAGPLPGLVGESVYTVKQARLDRHDKVLLATDGFFQVFKEKELEEYLKPLASKSGQEIAGNLWLEFQSRNETSGLGRDDATLIIAEYGGPS